MRFFCDCLIYFKIKVKYYQNEGPDLATYTNHNGKGQKETTLCQHTGIQNREIGFNLEDSKRLHEISVLKISLN